MNHPLQCRCGTVRGLVADPRSANHVVCYCEDCQAFAHFLGRQADVLDERGGSEVIQTLPRNVSFSQGIEALACIRLTHKGLLRWYTACCNTPIGNTLANPKLSFVGLLHSCLESPGGPLQDAFGPVRGWIYTKRAKGDPKPRTEGLGAAVLWFITNTLKVRINGDYKRTPFFRADATTPVASPRVLSSAEHERLMNAVRAGTR